MLLYNGVSLICFVVVPGILAEKKRRTNTVWHFDSPVKLRNSHVKWNVEQNFCRVA